MPGVEVNPLLEDSNATARSESNDSKVNISLIEGVSEASINKPINDI